MPADPSELFAGRYRLLAPPEPGSPDGACRVRDELAGEDFDAWLWRPAVDGDPETRARFLREARALAAVHHPSVTPALGLCEEGEHPCALFAHVAGTPLAALLERGPLAPRHAGELIADLLSGLAACHEAGVLHRNLEPRTVVLSPQGTPVLVGFALGTAIPGPGGGRGVSSGGFMAPELRRDPSAADARSDLYSAGMLLYALLSGGAPLSFDALDEIPAPLAAEIRRATRGRPDSRPRSAEELRRGILEGLAALPADASAPRAPARRGVTLGAFLTRPGATLLRDPRTPLQIGRLALALAVAGLGFVLLPSREQPLVSVVVSTAQPARWRIEGDADRSGASTPFALKLPPGRYTVTLVGPQEAQAVLDLSISGDEGSVRRCWDFARGGACDRSDGAR